MQTQSKTTIQLGFSLTIQLICLLLKITNPNTLIIVLDSKEMFQRLIVKS